MTAFSLDVDFLLESSHSVLSSICIGFLPTRLKCSVFKSMCVFRLSRDDRYEGRNFYFRVYSYNFYDGGTQVPSKVM